MPGISDIQARLEQLEQVVEELQRDLQFVATRAEDTSTQLQQIAKQHGDGSAV